MMRWGCREELPQASSGEGERECFDPGLAKEVSGEAMLTTCAHKSLRPHFFKAAQLFSFFSAATTSNFIPHVFS